MRPRPPARSRAGLDWLHLASGSLWLGGLVGLVLWGDPASSPPCRGAPVVVPRFSNVAFVSVPFCSARVWAAVLHLPILSALWTTSYGQTILVKASLLALAMGIGAVNLPSTGRGLWRRARPEVGPPPSRLGVSSRARCSC